MVTPHTHANSPPYLTLITTQHTLRHTRCSNTYTCDIGAACMLACWCAGRRAWSQWSGGACTSSASRTSCCAWATCSTHSSATSCSTTTPRKTSKVHRSGSHCIYVCACVLMGMDLVDSGWCVACVQCMRCRTSGRTRLDACCRTSCRRLPASPTTASSTPTSSRRSPTDSSSRRPSLSEDESGYHVTAVHQLIRTCTCIFACGCVCVCVCMGACMHVVEM